MPLHTLKLYHSTGLQLQLYKKFTICYEYFVRNIQKSSEVLVLCASDGESLGPR